jgi:CheY-like chemotaxis protein
MSKKILIVDDEPDIVRLLAARLRVNGYETVTAFNGSDGVEVALKEHPDLILLDILMPVMNGYQTLEKIKANESTKDIPVIMVSAKAQAEDKDMAKAKGAFDFVPKPFEPKGLLKTIKSAW